METNKINYITIQQYLDGSLDKDSMHELEKRALDDPFLADALEGYTHINKPAEKHLSFLQTQLEERIAQQQENKNVFNFSWQRLSVAAAASLLFITASILFWIKGQKNNEQLASNPKHVEVSLTPVDSMDTASSRTKQVEIVPAVPVEENIKITEDNSRIAVVKKEVPSLQKENNEVFIASEELSEVSIESNAEKMESRVAASSEILKSKSAPIRIRGMSSFSPKNIVGRVVTEKGEPLPGALVKLKNSEISATTDANGFFNFRDTVSGVFAITSIGFDPKEVNLKPGDAVTIALDEHSNALSETVVVGYGTSKEVNEFPEPSIGWTKYKNYLQNSLKSDNNAPSGRVVVTFKVGPNNQLSDFKIKKGLNDTRNQEAIRLIKEGPAWNIGKQSEASVTVRFK